MSKELTKTDIEACGSPLARVVELHDAVGSTQERARELARSGTPHGTLVISRTQLGGRGRRGRRWVSPPGGLWMSLVLRSELAVDLAPRITQVAALGVAKALWEIDVRALIKWPNDLLVDGRKICGILAESSAKRTRQKEHELDFAILGIGLNANFDPHDLEVPDHEVATLRSELGRDVDLLELLKIVLSSLDVELKRVGDFDAVLDDWRALNCTLGQRVRVQRFGETLEGVAADLTQDGALILKTRDGVVEILEGEIEHLRPGGF